jgi:hypothetical protein
MSVFSLPIDFVNLRVASVNLCGIALVITQSCTKNPRSFKELPDL